jgi:adenine deaminase
MISSNERAYYSRPRYDAGLPCSLSFGRLISQRSSKPSRLTTTADDITAAIKELERMRGGQVAIANGKVEAALALPIAGLVSDQPRETVIEQISKLYAASARLGSKLPAPFMSLSFLSLSPIPELKLTDQGLVDALT